MTRTLAELLVRWRWLFAVAALLLAIVAASGARFLGFSNDYRVFFGEDNPQLLAFENLQNTYTKSDNVLFVLAPADGKIFTPETLSAVEWLTEQAWQIPYSIRVDSVTNFQHTYAEGDDLIVEDLVTDAMGFNQEALDHVKQIALDEPLLVNRLISPRAHATGVNVVIQLPGIDPAAEVPEVVKFARQLAVQLETRYAGIDVHLTGIVFLNNAFSENSFIDMKTLVPLMFGIIVIVLALLLRSVWSTLVTVLVILLSIATAIGAAGWMGIQFTPPSASSPTMILTLAVANCVHLLVSFLQSLRQADSKADAMRESLRINLQPVFLTSVTTAIGFMSMNFSDAPPFRDLGNIVAVGVLSSFVYCLALLPALMLALPVRVKAARSHSVAAMDRLADFVVKRRRPVLWGMTLVVISLLALIPKNELNDEFVRYFDERVQFRVDTDFTTENLTGLYNISYSLGADGSGAVSDPVYLNMLEAFADW